MKHKYIKDTSVNAEEQKRHGLTKHQICTICGLKKCNGYYNRMHTILYERNGMNFKYSPDCIDWNSKDDIIMD